MRRATLCRSTGRVQGCAQAKKCDGVSLGQEGRPFCCLQVDGNTSSNKIRCKEKKSPKMHCPNRKHPTASYVAFLFYAWQPVGSTNESTNHGDQTNEGETDGDNNNNKKTIEILSILSTLTLTPTYTHPHTQTHIESRASAIRNTNSRG